MPQSTVIAATAIRIYALCFLAWAGLQFVGWAIQPVVNIIYSSGHESTGFDFSDIRELSQICVYALVFLALYITSLPVALSATSEPDRSIEYSVAFTSVRTIAFCFAIIVFMEGAFRLLEIPIDHIRHLNEEGGVATRSFWERASFHLSGAFGSFAAGLAILPFWLFARWIANVVTRPFQSNQVA